MNTFTLAYKMNNPVVFFAKVGDKREIDISVYLSGTFTCAVTDEKIWNDIRLPESLLKKSFEAHLVMPAYETGKKLAMPEELKDHAGEILETAAESVSEVWERSGIRLVGLTVDDVGIGPGDKAMLDEMQRRYAVETVSRRDIPPVEKIMGQVFPSEIPQIQAVSPAAVKNMKSVFDYREKMKPSAKETWVCGCGNENTGKFCTECGSPRDWICVCGQKNSGRFCTGCGRKRK